MIAAAPGVVADPELRTRLADLYADYENTLNEGALERWPELFSTDCVYKVLPKENQDAGFPIAVMYCESRDMLADRVVALRQTAVYVPRIMRLMTSGICLRRFADDGLYLTASFVMFQTMQDKPSDVFLCGAYQDRVIDDAGALRFAERLCIYDSTIVPLSLVYPI
jgi:3-phenylpropionate/cinnamic acid dioxygenase small subunit